MTLYFFCRQKEYKDFTAPAVLIPHMTILMLAMCSQIFLNDGQFKSRFGVRGRSPGQLQRPTGVAVHPNGDIIIADYDNKWVSIFTSEGKFKVCLII